MAKRVQLTDIDSKTWEHPADRAALTALKAVPGLDSLLKFFLGSTNEKQFRMLFLASAVRVSESQFPRVDKLVKEACRILDVEPIPEVYVQQTPFLNAGVLGVDKPFIILNSSILGILDDDELLYIIGHELGHCLSGHVLYKTILAFLLNVSLLFLRFPGIGIVIQGIIFALREWDRKSELSADRAGLLTVQDPKPVFSALMKLTGGENIGEMDMNAFLQQAADYDRGGDVADSFFKFVNMLTITHPFPVIRLPEIKAWFDGGAYEKVMGGDYVRRDPNAKGNVFTEFKEARKQYQEDLKGSKDPLAGFAAEMGKIAETVGQGAMDTLSSLFGTSKKD